MFAAGRLHPLETLMEAMARIYAKNTGINIRFGKNFSTNGKDITIVRMLDDTDPWVRFKVEMFVKHEAAHIISGDYPYFFEYLEDNGKKKTTKSTIFNVVRDVTIEGHIVEIRWPGTIRKYKILLPRLIEEDNNPAILMGQVSFFKMLMWATYFRARAYQHEADCGIILPEAVQEIYDRRILPFIPDIAAHDTIPQSQELTEAIYEELMKEPPPQKPPPPPPPPEPQEGEEEEEESDQCPQPQPGDGEACDSDEDNPWPDDEEEQENTAPAPQSSDDNEDEESGDEEDTSDGDSGDESTDDSNESEDDSDGSEDDSEDNESEDNEPEDNEPEDGDSEDNEPEDGDSEDNEPEDGDSEDNEPEDGDSEENDSEDNESEDGDSEDNESDEDADESEDEDDPQSGDEDEEPESGDEDEDPESGDEEEDEDEEDPFSDDGEEALKKAQEEMDEDNGESSVNEDLTDEINEYADDRMLYRETAGLTENVIIPDERYDWQAEVCKYEAEGRKVTGYCGPKLKTLFISMKAPVTRRHLKNGRLDCLNLWKTKMGSREVMKRKTPSTLEDSAVYFVADHSSSMNGTKGDLTHSILTSLSSDMDKMRIPFEAIGFTCPWIDEVPSGKTNGQEGIRSVPINIHMLKRFDEQYVRVRHRFVWPTRTIATAELPAIVYGANRLILRRETKKVMFILTDGGTCTGISALDTAMQTATKEFIERMKMADIKVVLIGIMDQTPLIYDPNAIILDDLNVFATTFYNKLMDILL